MKDKRIYNKTYLKKSQQSIIKSGYKNRCALCVCVTFVIMHVNLLLFRVNYCHSVKIKHFLKI